MLDIPKEKALERLDELPEGIREVLFSIEGGDILFTIAKEQHLSEQKADIFVGAVAATLFGFLHPTDLAKELREDLGIDPKLAETLADQADKKLFAPIKREILKAYKPYVPSGEGEIMSGIDQAIKISVGMINEAVSGGEVFVPVKRVAPAPARGISSLRVFPEEMRRMASEVRIQTQAPSPVPVSPFATSAPSPDLERPRTDELFQPAPVAQPIPTAPAAKPFGAAQDKPFVLYEEKTAQPVSSVARKTSVGFSMPFGFFSKDKASMVRPTSVTPPVRASIDVGVAGPGPVKTSVPGILGKIMRREQARTVHYAGPSTEVTPFKKEKEGVFKVEAAPATDKAVGEVAVKPILEKTPEGDIAVKIVGAPTRASMPAGKNPFGFPVKPGNGPRVEGNTVHLN